MLYTYQIIKLYTSNVYNKNKEKCYLDASAIYSFPFFATQTGLLTQILIPKATDSFIYQTKWMSHWRPHKEVVDHQTPVQRESYLSQGKFCSLNKEKWLFATYHILPFCPKMWTYALSCLSGKFPWWITLLSRSSHQIRFSSSSAISQLGAWACYVSGNKQLFSLGCAES